MAKEDKKGVPMGTVIKSSAVVGMILANATHQPSLGEALLLTGVTIATSITTINFLEDLQKEVGEIKVNKS